LSLVPLPARLGTTKTKIMLKKSTGKQTITYKSLILCAAALIFSSASIHTAMAQCRTTLSDTNFAALANPGYTQEFPGDGVPGYFRVTRVVGPGTTSEFTQAASPTVPLGTLINASTYVQNGVVSSQAYVQVTGSMTWTISFGVLPLWRALERPRI
jgi:hypothetical protein